MRFSAYSNDDGDCAGAGLALRLPEVGATVDASVVVVDDDDADDDDSTTTLLLAPCSFIRCIRFSSNSF